MMGDGGALFTQATGLVFDLTAKGFGVRSQRYSMLVDNGVVKTLNVEGPGKFEVSDAATLLAQAQG
jgi:peroxiredoxin